MIVQFSGHILLLPATSTLCMMGNFAYFLSSADFSKFNVLKNVCMNNSRVSNSLDPNQARHFVRPDLGPNFWQRLSADDTNR